MTTDAYLSITLTVPLAHSMNMVESIFWNNDDWKGKLVGVVPRVCGQHQVGRCSLHTLCMSASESTWSLCAVDQHTTTATS